MRSASSGRRSAGRWAARWRCTPSPTPTRTKRSDPPKNRRGRPARSARARRTTESAALRRQHPHRLGHHVELAALAGALAGIGLEARGADALVARLVAAAGAEHLQDL